MPSDGTGSPKSPASDDGFTLVGKGGKPASKAGKGSGSQVSSPTAEAPAGGLDSSIAPDKSGSSAGTASGKKPLPKPRSQSPGRDAEADRHAELLAAISGLSSELKSVSTRVSELEQESSRGHPASEDEDRSDGGYFSDGSSRGSSEASEQLSSSDDESDGKSYIRVPRNLGHWNCRELEGSNDQMPHRYSLHGYEPFDGLQQTKHGGSGTLGLGLRWMEPTCLYFKTGLGGLRNSLKRLDELRDDMRAGGEPVTRAELADLRHELMAGYNTLAGAFELGNTYRTLLVERAKVLAPNSKRADKERAEWVEKAIDEQDYAAADAADDVRRLKAEYDYEAHKADLRRAASKGGSSAGERSDRRDDESRGGGKTKTQKRRERRDRKREERSNSRERSGRGGGGGSSSRGSDGGGRKTTRRDESRERGARNDRSKQDGRDARKGGGRDRRDRSTSADSRRGSGKGGGGGKRDGGKDRRGGGDSRRSDGRHGSRRSGGYTSDSGSDHSWS